jgi:ComF family protein
VGNRLCSACQEDLPHHPFACCPICALPTSNAELCGHCLKNTPAFEHTVAALSYRFPADRLIQTFKYAANLACGNMLAHLLLAKVQGQSMPDTLIPMPLHASRLKERGFNQSVEIAKVLARELALPLQTRGIERVKPTLPQAEIAWDERAKNVRKAFSCNLDLRGRDVAIVDDVMTSGATANELSKILRKCGAQSIHVWVVARTIPN